MQNDQTNENAHLPTQRARVAIVEDNSSIREILVLWIKESEEFTFAGDFGDAESAKEPLRALSPDIVLVDINLPGQSGIDLVRSLSPSLRNTQFVMVTVYEDSEYIFGALSAGAIGYLLKRTPRQELLEALREVQHGGSPMSSTIARKVVDSFQSKPPEPVHEEVLSKRENEVLVLLAQGYLCKEISDQVGISLATVKTYIRRIYEKLHVHSRAQAVARFMEVSQKKR